MKLETRNLKFEIMEEKQNNYIELWDLDAYKLARQYSKEGWKIYQRLDWKMRKITGDQMIESIDSVGANIAEGYGRFHYLDKNKFYCHIYISDCHACKLGISTSNNCAGIYYCFLWYLFLFCHRRYYSKLIF